MSVLRRISIGNLGLPAIVTRLVGLGMMFEVSRLARVEDGWYLRFGPQQALVLYWADGIQVLGDVLLLLTMACVVQNLARTLVPRRTVWLVIASTAIILTSLAARVLFTHPFGPIGVLQCLLAGLRLAAVLALSTALLGRTGRELLAEYARLWPVAAIGLVWLDTFFHPVPLRVLNHATVTAVRWVLMVLEGADAFAISERPVSALVRLGGFQVDLLPVCSGYEGLLLFSGLFAAYLLVARRWPGVPELAVYAVTLPILFLVNVMRIVILLELGARLAPEGAIYGFHSRFGILAVLCLSCLAILVVERWRDGRVGKRALQAGWNDASVLSDFLPLATMLGMELALGFYRSVIDWFYPATMAAAVLVLWWTHGRRRHPGLGLPLKAFPILAGCAVYGLWVTLIPVDQIRSLGMDAQLAGVSGWLAGSWIVMRLFGAAYVVPVIEELAFRSGLWRIVESALTNRLPGPTIAVATLTITSTAFAAMHSHFVPAFLAGAAFGLIRMRRSGLPGAIVAHGLANALLGLHVIATSEWSYW